MTTPTRTSTEQPQDRGAEDFTTGEGLRALLNRLAEGGEDGWDLEDRDERAVVRKVKVDRAFASRERSGLVAQQDELVHQLRRCVALAGDS